jgi:hypothetical protein
MLDKQSLERLKAQAEEQRDKYIQMLHEANGAIGMLNHLLRKIEEDKDGAERPHL